MVPLFVRFLLTFALAVLEFTDTAKGAAIPRACSDQFLITATNTTDGVDVRIFPPGASGADQLSYRHLEITGHFLSPECGDDCFRCGELFVVEYTVPATPQVPQYEQHVAILPLEKGVGLLKTKLDRNGMLFVSEKFHFVSISPRNCSPTTVHHIRNSYYVMCLNTGIGLLTVLELRLNVTHIKKSFFEFEFYDKKPLTDISNSLSIYRNNYEPLIFFAAGYDMFYIDIISEIILRFDIKLKSYGCYVTSLAFIDDDDEFLAYCQNRQAVYIDLRYERIFHSINYTIDGHPFVCPDSNVYLSVNAGSKYIQYALRDQPSVKNIDIPLLNFDNGVCLEVHNNTFFAYTDKESGVHVLKVPEDVLMSLSSVSCLNYSCQRLVLLQHRYLVVREKRGFSWFIMVFDSSGNFSLVLEAQHTSADIMAVVQDAGACQEQSDDANQKEASEATHFSEQGNSDSKETTMMITIPVVIVVFLIIVLLMVGVGILIAKLVKKQEQTSSPIEAKQSKPTKCEYVVPKAGSENAVAMGRPVQNDGQQCGSQESDSTDGLRNNDQLASSSDTGTALHKQRLKSEARKNEELKQEKRSKYARDKSPEAKSLLNTSD